jgi:Uncharacterized protein conserved in bacteria (DUF2252)
VERINNVEPHLPRGDDFWEPKAYEKAALAGLIDRPALRALVTSLKMRKTDAPVELLDAAYWVKGCSSLGRLRYAVLVGVNRHKRRRKDIALIDIKEATKAAAPSPANRKMPSDDADRVVEGARHLAPNLGQRMLSARLEGRSVVVRELLPQDLKLEIDRLARDEALHAARYLAYVVGRAHARQMDDKSRQKWRAQLLQRHPKSLDAPSWLWKSVVDLLGSHEVGYSRVRPRAYCRLAHWPLMCLQPRTKPENFTGYLRQPRMTVLFAAPCNSIGEKMLTPSWTNSRLNFQRSIYQMSVTTTAL